MKSYRKYYKNGQLMYESWSADGVPHRVDGPTRQHWSEGGQLTREVWYIYGRLHRVDGPAFRTWSKTGLTSKGGFVNPQEGRSQLEIEEWVIEGKIVEPISDPLEWALFIAKAFGDVHGLEDFCQDNIEEKVARAILASARLL